MPMVKPALATIGILSFQSAWGATEASVYFLNDESLRASKEIVSLFTVVLLYSNSLPAQNKDLAEMKT